MNSWAAGTGVGSQDLVQRTDGGTVCGETGCRPAPGKEEGTVGPGEEQTLSRGGQRKGTQCNEY